jgi:hypothetical protein
MPHPSIPLDDISAPSFDREHGHRAFTGSRGRLGLCIAVLLSSMVKPDPASGASV